MAGRAYAFVWFPGRQVMHLLNRDTGSSFCQAENNYRAHRSFKERLNKLGYPICKNCETVKAQLSPETDGPST